MSLPVTSPTSAANLKTAPQIAARMMAETQKTRGSIGRFPAQWGHVVAVLANCFPQ